MEKPASASLVDWGGYVAAMGNPTVSQHGFKAEAGAQIFVGVSPARRKLKAKPAE